MSKEEILGALRQARIHNPLHQPSYTHVDSMVYDRNDLFNVYLQYQKANMANVVLSSRDKLSEDINEILSAQGIDELLCAKNIMAVESSAGKIIDSINANKFVYEKSVDETRDKLFDIKASLIHARVGVANLGILGLATGEQNPRLASLVVTTCIVLLRKRDIVANLFEAFEKLKVAGDNEGLPTNIVFMAGPSRTADIELQTVFGVHGPQNVFVLLYE